MATAAVATLVTAMAAIPRGDRRASDRGDVIEENTGLAQKNSASPFC